MKKYNIEGNVDFFSELYKSLDDEDNQDKEESDDKLCLITNQLLIDKFVELDCGHKFNYIPLYNDIYNHKKKFNNMEGSSSLLKMNEIRCPYCRKKQLGVLPYYEELIPEKTNGVNFYDYIQTSSTYINSQGIFSYGKCEFIVNTPTSISTITFSGHCSSTYVTKSECDNKTYCWSHNRTITKQFEKEKKEKEKEAQKQLKKEAKQKEKEAKQKEKEDKKAEEKIKKESLKKTSKKTKNLILSITDVEEENIIISSSIQTINEGCTQIIKTGPNKGNFCGLVILNDCLCKRHYNLKNKVLL
jgi:hypothetical protein